MIRKQVLIAGALGALSSLLFGQAQTNTGRHPNGRLWIHSSKTAKHVYTLGFIDGLEISKKLADLPKGFLERYISDLDTFYETNENLNIPIYLATDYLVQKRKGTITKEKEPFYIEAMRQVSKEIASESPPLK